MIINEKLDTIEKQISIIHDDLSSIFAVPAEKGDLELLTKTFSNLNSIARMKIVYERYNGQLRDWENKDAFGGGCVAEATLWNIVLDEEIVESAHFFSINEMLKTYTMMNELISAGSEKYYCDGADAGIDSIYWSSDWIPFGTTAGGDLLCLDQKSEAVIYICHEGGKRRIVAKTFEDFLDRWSIMLSETVIIKSEGEKYSVSFDGITKIVTSINEFPWDIIPDRMDIQAFYIGLGFFNLVNIEDYF